MDASTDCLSHRPATDFSCWRARLAAARNALSAYWRARSERSIDRWFVQERKARERVLAEARDVFELERMERDYERRARDGWRF